MKSFYNSYFFKALVWINALYMIVGIIAILLIIPGQFLITTKFEKVHTTITEIFLAPIHFSGWAVIPMILLNLPLKYVDMSSDFTDRYSEKRIAQFQIVYGIYFFIFLIITVMMLVGLGLSGSMNANY